MREHGLTPAEELMTVEAWFDLVEWEPRALDPEMPAEDFLDAL